MTIYARNPNDTSPAYQAARVRRQSRTSLEGQRLALRAMRARRQEEDRLLALIPGMADTETAEEYRARYRQEARRIMGLVAD